MTSSHIDPSASTRNAQSTSASISRGARVAGLVMSILPASMLALDGAMKLVAPAEVVKASADLGFPAESLTGIGIALLASVLLYLVPRTAVLGAILLTGYLGGAVATHVRVDNPLFSHTLFPVYFAVLLWGGLWLRDARIRALLPTRK